MLPQLRDPIEIINISDIIFNQFMNKVSCVHFCNN